MCNCSVFKFTSFLKVFQRHKELQNLGWCANFNVHVVDEIVMFEFKNKAAKRNDINGIFSICNCYYCSIFFIFKENKKMASKKVEQKKKVLRFRFIIHDAVDYEINKKTPEIIDSISSASLVKALELVRRQHYGCNCYHCKLYKMIIEKLLKRNDTYLIAPETLD